MNPLHGELFSTSLRTDEGGPGCDIASIRLGDPLGNHCSVGQICFDWFGLGWWRDEMYPRHKWSERCTRVTTRSSRASPHGTAGLYGHNIGMPSGWFCIPQSRPVTNGSYVYLYSIESSRPLYRSSKIVYKNDLI